MQQPKYKPNQWVAYTAGVRGGGGFGVIVGGYHNGDHWSYTVKGANSDGDAVHVTESNIVLVFDGQGWYSV